MKGDCDLTDAFSFQLKKSDQGGIERRIGRLNRFDVVLGRNQTKVGLKEDTGAFLPPPHSKKSDQGGIERFVPLQPLLQATYLKKSDQGGIERCPSPCLHHQENSDLKKSDQGGIESIYGFDMAMAVRRRNQTKVGLKAGYMSFRLPSREEIRPRWD